MTTTFQVGQRVRCVANADTELKLNEVYTVKISLVDEDGDSMVGFEDDDDVTYFSHRFEPWPDPPADMLEVIEDAECEHKDIESRCLKCGESKGEDVFELVRQRDELRRRADDNLAMLRSTEERLRHVAGQRDAALEELRELRSAFDKLKT